MLFDLDQFIKQSSNGNLMHYFEKIKKAENKQLKEFKIAVKAHSKTCRNRYAASVTPQGTWQFSPHKDWLLKAIWWQEIVRSPLKKWFWNSIRPLIKWWCGLWYGMDFKDDAILGYVLKHREHGDTLLQYIGLRQYLKKIGRRILQYIIDNHKWLITTALGFILGMGYLQK